MRPTSAASLAVAALLGALVGGSIGPLIEAAGGRVPTVPWSAVVTLVLLGAVLLGLAWTTWRSLRRPSDSTVRRMDPQRAVVLLVLGRSGALGGAAIFGGYLAFGLGFLGDDAPLPHQRLVRGLLAAAATVLVVVGGLLLERACRVPGGGDDDPDDSDDPYDSHHRDRPT
jgi:hypothetical protein